MELALTILLWVLGIVFLGAGGMKAAMPLDRLSTQPNMGWVERTSPFEVRLAGVSEVVAAVTFLLTALDVGFFGDQPWIAGVAAVGIVVVMGLAAVRVHQPAGEPTTINVMFGTLAGALAVLAFVVAAGG